MLEKDYYNILFDYVKDLNEMTAHDKALCQEHMKIIYPRKDTILSSTGNVPRYHYFIISGYLRKFIYNDSFEEVTIDLNDGSRWMSSYEFFFNRTESNETIHTLSDCILLSISRDAFQVLAEKGDTFSNYCILLFQNIIVKNKLRMANMSTLSADQKYLNLVTTQPNIVKNVPLKYIASYLGMNPGSLSRIRKNLSIPLHFN